MSGDVQPRKRKKDAAGKKKKGVKLENFFAEKVLIDLKI